MNLARLSWILLSLVSVSAGLLTGRTLGRSGFDETEWPSRGSGPRLVEYFDPSCAASRALHERLDELLGPSPRVEHVLVPISISRTSEPTEGDRLCALSRDQAFEAARAWAREGAAGPAGAEPDGAALASCAGRVERATQHTATLSPYRAPTAPVVTFGGRTFDGLKELPALEAALGELP